MILTSSRAVPNGAVSDISDYDVTKVAAPQR